VHDPFDLERFVHAQARNYAQALAEIKDVAAARGSGWRPTPEACANRADGRSSVAIAREAE
jgi:uncharacterized protein (DUF1810 family)